MTDVFLHHKEINLTIKIFSVKLNATMSSAKLHQQLETKIVFMRDAIKIFSAFPREKMREENFLVDSGTQDCYIRSSSSEEKFSCDLDIFQ